MRPSIFKTICLIALLAFSSEKGEASSIAVNSFNGFGLLATSSGDEILGWEFNTSTGIDVTALGVREVGNAVDGLAIAHDVGILDVTTQSLLMSTTVAAGPCSLGLSGFCFNTLVNPVPIGPGNYVIVMTMPAGNADKTLSSLTSVGTAPEITYITSVIDAGTSLHFPNPTFNGMHDAGLFGPNFLFETEATAVPEPATLSLLGSALCVMSARRRKRRTT